MKHIQLLTMESYLDAKKELVENAGYTMKELHIDNVERIEESLNEIYEFYFEKKTDGGQEDSLGITFKEKNGDYEIGVINKQFIHKETFLKSVKDKYGHWIQENRELEVAEDIKSVLDTVFTFSNRLYGDIEKRIYAIIKYTLSKEEVCDYIENGKFIESIYKKQDDEVILPFEIEYGSLPIYCQEMQRTLFGVHRLMFVRSSNSMHSLDITRFSFYNVKKIVDTVTKKIESSEYYIEDDKKCDEGYRYIEGIEDYLLLDEILGISLTNIVYWKTKEIKEREVQDNIIKLIAIIAKCHCSIGRNAVAQVLIDYLEAADYNANVIQEMGKLLERGVKAWNEYYEDIEAVVLCTMFSYLKGCSEDDLVKVCEDLENDTWTEYIYMEEIAKSNDMIKVSNLQRYEKENKIRIPKKEMDSRTWYAYIHKTVFEAIWS